MLPSGDLSRGKAAPSPAGVPLGRGERVARARPAVPKARCRPDAGLADSVERRWSNRRSRAGRRRDRRRCSDVRTSPLSLPLRPLRSGVRFAGPSSTSSTSMRNRPAWPPLRCRSLPGLPVGERRSVCTRHRTSRSDIPPPFRWIERIVAPRRAAAVHTCNDEAGTVLRRKGFSGIVRNLGLGVDVGRFTPKTSTAEPSAMNIGYVERLEAHKGVKVLVAAMALLPGCSLEDPRRRPAAIGDRAPDRRSRAR